MLEEFGIIAPQSTDTLRYMVSEQKNSLPLGRVLGRGVNSAGW